MTRQIKIDLKLLLGLSVVGDEVFLPLGVLFSPFFFSGTYKVKHGKAKVIELHETLSESDWSLALAYILAHIHATLPPTVYKQFKDFPNQNFYLLFLTRPSSLSLLCLACPF